MLDRLRSLFRAPERKSLSAPTDEELRIFTGGFLPGALAISAGDALKVPAVQLSIRLIAEGVAALDRRVVRIDGGREVDAPEHPASRFLDGRWNTARSAYEGVRDLISAALCNDAGGMAWCNRVGGEIREIVFYRTSLTVQHDTDTGEPTYTLGTREVPAGDVIHVRGAFDRCPLTLARESIAVAATMSDRAGKMMKNADRPAGWIEFEEDLDEEAFIRMKKSWEEAHGSPENTGKTAILYNKGKYQTVEWKSVDQQFVELRKEQVVEIGRAFGIPPSMLFNHDRATWSNYEAASKEWIVNTLEGWCKITEAALSRALLSEDEQRTHRIIIDRDDLTRADIGARATAYSQLIAARVINPNQARKWEGLDPYEGGEAYLNPNITVSTRTTGPAKPDEEDA